MGAARRPVTARGRRLGLGARVFLRAPTAGDRAEFLALARSSRKLHRPWVSPPATPAAFAAFLRRARQPNRVSALVCCRADGVIVGVVNVSEIVRGALQGAFLGYYGSAAHTGQGYMTEGVALILSLAFGHLGLHRLEANVQPGNRASLALVRRLGFRLEGFSPRYLKIAGRWRDHQRWAIRREDWTPARRRATGRRGAGS
jgi:ribosomal-protein-alanine N-acetyltransferase